MKAVNPVVTTQRTAHMPLPMNHVAAGSVSACTSIGSLAQVTGPPVGSVLLTELGGHVEGRFL